MNVRGYEYSSCGRVWVAWRWPRAPAPLLSPPPPHARSTHAPDSTRSCTIWALPLMARPTRQVRPMMRPVRLRMQLMRWSVRLMPARLSPPNSPTWTRDRQEGVEFGVLGGTWGVRACGARRQGAAESARGSRAVVHRWLSLRPASPARDGYPAAHPTQPLAPRPLRVLRVATTANNTFNSTPPPPPASPLHLLLFPVLALAFHLPRRRQHHRAGNRASPCDRQPEPRVWPPPLSTCPPAPRTRSLRLLAALHK